MFHLQQELHYVAKKRFEYVDKYVFGGHFLTVSRLKVHPGVKLSRRQSSKPGWISELSICTLTCLLHNTEVILEKKDRHQAQPQAVHHSGSTAVTFPGNTTVRTTATVHLTIIIITYELKDPRDIYAVIYYIVNIINAIISMYKPVTIFTVSFSKCLKRPLMIVVFWTKHLCVIDFMVIHGTLRQDGKTVDKQHRLINLSVFGGDELETCQCCIDWASNKQLGWWLWERWLLLSFSPHHCAVGFTL